MPLKLFVENPEGLPAEQQSLYVAKDGKYQLDDVGERAVEISAVILSETKTPPIEAGYLITARF